MYKIVWDKENNGIILTLNSNDETLNIAPRPVFYEELDLLGLNKYWKYPKSKEPLLWACERRYFYFGEKILEVKGGNIYDEPEIILEEKYKNINLVPINIDLLIEKNKSSMFLLEYEALEFINDVYRKYSKNPKEINIHSQIDYDKLAEIQEERTKIKHAVIKEDCDSFDIMPLSEAEDLGKKIVHSSKIEMFISSFSGGKDSQVVLDLVSRVIPPSEFSVIYSDTGYEIPPSLEIYEETKEIYQKKYPEMNFYLSRNHQDVLFYWDKMGPPSNIHRWCCTVMKTAPLYRLLKLISNKNRQAYILTFDGIRAEESIRRAKYERIGKSVKHNNVINASPILNWNSTEIFLYIFKNQLLLNSAYRNGLTRVGCVLCPFSSNWNDNINAKLYKETIRPFEEKIKNVVDKSGVKDIDNYIKEGNWKIRAGGRFIENESILNILELKPNFKAIIANPSENILEWFKVLGKLQYSLVNDNIQGYINYDNRIKSFSITYLNNSAIIEFYEVTNDIIFISLLKKVLNKITFCIHCESCEVECPTGALQVVPSVKIIESKCIHCYKCINFNPKGCVITNSITITEGNNMNSKKKSINRYNNFGFRNQWLFNFFNSIEDFFSTNHGLNVKNQIPSFTNWLIDSQIMEISSKKITETGSILKDIYKENQRLAWEIIWINLANNSEICNWYSRTINYIKKYSLKEIEELLQNDYSDYSTTTLINAYSSLKNTFKESPLGDEILVGISLKKDNVQYIYRQEHKNISLLSVAYSLYKYAEKNERYNLRVSEFYNENQSHGIYKEFGLSKEKFETILRSLKEEKNRVLNVELNMGLDNINLRQDLKAIDILKLMK